MSKSLAKILFAGSSDPETARKLSEKANVPFGRVLIKKFASGEKYINLLDNPKNKIVYLYQTTAQNPDEILMETFLIADAAKGAEAKKIILIMPFLSYSRQEKKTKKEMQEPISAELLARLIETSGIQELITVHLHSQRILNFYKAKIVNIETEKIFGKRLEEIIRIYPEPFSNFVVVSPDKGGRTSAQKLASFLGNLKMCCFEKQRESPVREINISEPLKFYGDVSRKRAIIFDDIVDTGRTVISAKQELIKRGVLEVMLCVTHPVFSGKTLEKLAKANFSRIIVSDSIPLKRKIKRLEVISLVEEITNYLK